MKKAAEAHPYIRVSWPQALPSALDTLQWWYIVSTGFWQTILEEMTLFSWAAGGSGIHSFVIPTLGCRGRSWDHSM